MTDATVGEARTASGAVAQVAEATAVSLAAGTVVADPAGAGDLVVAGGAAAVAAAQAAVAADPNAQAFYAQAGYYPTVSYAAAGQPFGAAQQVMSPYQYVMPQAAYAQPAYGWAYYPSGQAPARTDGTAPALTMGGMAVVPKDGEAAAQLSEREQKALRRKQANRESARRSKIRKKAESENLGKKAGELDGESRTLAEDMEKYSEMVQQLKEQNDKLRQEAALKGIPVDDLPQIDIDAFQLPHDQDPFGMSPTSTGPTSGHQTGEDVATCGTSVLKREDAQAIQTS